MFHYEKHFPVHNETGETQSITGKPARDWYAAGQNLFLKVRMAGETGAREIGAVVKRLFHFHRMKNGIFP